MSIRDIGQILFGFAAIACPVTCFIDQISDILFYALNYNEMDRFWSALFLTCIVYPFGSLFMIFLCIQAVPGLTQYWDCPKKMSLIILSIIWPFFSLVNVCIIIMSFTKIPIALFRTFCYWSKMT